MWFDLSPLRPDEWARTRARPWREAAMLRSAYREGYDAVMASRREREEIDAELRRKAQELAR